jgi:anti-sigma B factor antagonist
MTGRTLTIRVYGKPTHLIIAATGEIDITTVGRLRDQLFGLVSDGRPLVVELDNARLVDAAGLGVLVGAAHRAAAHGIGLYAVSARQETLELFELTGLDRQIPLARTVEEAIHDLIALRPQPGFSFGINALQRVRECSEFFNTEALEKIMQLLIVAGQLGETGRYLVRARERRGHRGGAGVEGPGCRGAGDVGALCRGPAPPGPARVSLRVDYDERRSTRPPRSSTTRPAFARSWMRSTDWPTTPARPGRFPTGRLTCGGCGWAGTGSCTRSPMTRSRSATWPAAPETDPERNPPD